VADIRLALIAAVAENRVIGHRQALPWRLKTDMQRFKRLTMGKPVIMGRKTHESIGKALPGRTNIVVSAAGGVATEGVMVATNLGDALSVARRHARADGVDEVFIIGGEQVYRAALPIADRLYITHVDAAPEGDAHFDPIDPATWRAVSSEPVPAGGNDTEATTFAVYERIGPGDQG